MARRGYVAKSKQVDGERYWAYGKTEREAQRKLDDIIFEVRQNGQKLDGNTTVRKWAKEWLEVYIDTRDITKASAAMYHRPEGKDHHAGHVQAGPQKPPDRL